MSELTLQNMSAIAFHLESGEDNAGIAREALALFIRGAKDTFEKELSALEAENKRLRDQWIPVEERLPDNDQRILFYSQGGDTINGMYRDELWFFDTGREYENSPVTHWMPLPEPPNGGNND